MAWLFHSDEKSTVDEGLVCQVLFAQKPAQQLEELGHGESDDSGEEGVPSEQVNEEEDHHVEHGQGKLVSVEEDGIEGVPVVRIEDGFVRNGHVVKFAV